MIAVPGRVLTAPRVIYSGNNTVRPVGGSWNMSAKKVLKPVTLSNWTILRIGAVAELDLKMFDPQWKALANGFRSCGLLVNAPILPGPCVPVLNAGNQHKAVLDKVFVDSKFQAIFDQCKVRGISMLLVVLSTTTPWIRERIKFWGDTVHGMS